VLHSLDCTSAVRHCNHYGRIEAMLLCPATPRTFNASGGVDEDAIEVEQDSGASQGKGDRHRTLSGIRLFLRADAQSFVLELSSHVVF
jgi:hypothetical protein